jgi:Protein of unknown function (DUF616)
VVPELRYLKLDVYSAIYGDYDQPKSAAKIMSDRRPVMYTDTKETAEQARKQGWQPVIVNHSWSSPNGDPAIVTPMLNHKYWKCHPDVALPESDLSIWIDGSIEVTTEAFVENCLKALDNDDWACMRHPARDCIYPEADYSATLTWRYDAGAMLAQAAHYRNFHPSNWGLIATGANVRRHTPEVIETSHLWWDEIINWSHQDQISLPVLLRLREDKVKWNMNLSWHQDWTLHPHGE